MGLMARAVLTAMVDRIELFFSHRATAQRVRSRFERGIVYLTEDEPRRLDRGSEVAGSKSAAGGATPVAGASSSDLQDIKLGKRGTPPSDNS